ALERTGQLRQLFRQKDISRHLERWHEDPKNTPVGFILAMEGADCVLDPDDLVGWCEAGLRVIGLAHYGPGIYAYGTASHGPLTSRGRELLRRMEETGCVLDVTHLADESFWDALE